MPRSDNKLEVSEIFFSIQGEGPDAGKPATFVRFCRCPLACTWCDSKYAWDGHYAFESYTVSELKLRLLESQQKVRRLVLTGGEPLLWGKYFEELLEPFVFGLNTFVEIETSGIIPPLSFLKDWPRYRYNVSPKLSSSGNATKVSLNLPILSQYNLLGKDQACFKFVCTDPDELLEVQTVLYNTGIAPSRVWIMPEGTDTETLLELSRRLVGPVMKMGYNFSQRQHVLLWGNEKGS